MLPHSNCSDLGKTRLEKVYMRGRQFSEDLRWTVICAGHRRLDLATTSALTGISGWQVRRIRMCYGWTGDVRTVHDQQGAETRGRNVALTMEHRTVRKLHVCRRRQDGRRVESQDGETHDHKLQVWKLRKSMAKPGTSEKSLEQLSLLLHAGTAGLSSRLPHLQQIPILEFSPFRR
jgi:hypothetical protein